jgi:pimeloyl-ACP methyl ester carboxylesterase
VSLATAARFAGHFTVYVTGRKPGLAPGTAMAGIAADLARVIGDEFGEPVAVHGTSAGGAVGLQLAIGYPDLVRRLVLAAAACRLSPAGRQLLAEVARLVTAGEARRASARVARALAPRPLRCPVGALGWLANLIAADDLADLLITNAAAIAFDAGPELYRVQAPTLGDRRHGRPVLLRGPVPAHRRRDPSRAGRDLSRQGPSVCQQFPRRGRHRRGVPARRMSGPGTGPPALASQAPWRTRPGWRVTRGPGRADQVPAG